MKVKFHTDKAVNAAYEIAMAALNKEAEALLTEAVSRAPKDEGDLRASGIVKKRDGKIYVTFNTKYARRQHEELTWKHKDGEAKYLENPAKARKAMIKKRVKQAVKLGLAGKK